MTTRGALAITVSGGATAAPRSNRLQKPTRVLLTAGMPEAQGVWVLSPALTVEPLPTSPRRCLYSGPHTSEALTAATPPATCSATSSSVTAKSETCFDDELCRSVDCVVGTLATRAPRRPDSSATTIDALRVVEAESLHMFGDHN